MRVTSFRSTYCFVTVGGTEAQVVRVSVAGAPQGAQATVSVTGDQLETVAPWRGRLDPRLAGVDGGPAWAPANDPFLAGPGRFTPSPGLPEGVVVEVPVAFAEGLPAGAKVAAHAQVEAGGETASADAELVVREPGWRMFMVPHFHYDPVWWCTQAGYTSAWDELLWAQDRREPFQHSGIACVEAHLERARVDPAYKFVLAEVDYLKPFWDLYPDRRAELRALMAAGRLEIVGGTYNEANTNLTGAETAIRVAVYGFGFQRDVMGATPESAWQLDVFGHDPQFPGIMADCGASCSAWARGPFHQWGPRKEVGPNSWMQFPSEFEWVAPNGRGLLTSYMPNHYSAGWELEMASSLEGAMWVAYQVFSDLAEVSATRVTLLPVGTDYTPPGRYTTDVAAAWAKRYVWPRFEVGLPAEFFAAVRAELAGRGERASPQTRDMGPVYTGKDVSYIDTKQAQRLAEATLADAEAMAAVAGVLGAPVPYRELDKAWRQLVFGAHHDGITGSESDQVYLDLLGGWREAYELARRVERRSRGYLVSFVTPGSGGSVVVTNTLGFERSDLVSLALPAGAELEGLEDGAGEPVPLLCEAAGEPGGSGRTVTFLARSVPGIGYRAFNLTDAVRIGPPGHAGWRAAEGTSVSNEHFEVVADPTKGGGIVSFVDRASGFELVPAGEVANELLLYPEYPSHPRFGEGPWHLLPKGPPARSGSRQASVRAERSELGERLVVEGSLGLQAPFFYRQAITLWKGLRRAELSTEVHGWSGGDELLRLRFPTCLEGATPVCAVGYATVARGFALIDVDAAQHPWTLDSPCAEWFGLSTTLVVEARDGEAFSERSVGVAELVVPPGEGGASWARELLVALVQKGVTATCSEAGRNRYGALAGDSNLPDFRIAVGGPGENAFVAAVLSHAAPAYREHLEAEIARHGSAVVLVPAERPLREVWRPGADLRGPRALPVLVVAAEGGARGRTGEAVTSLAQAVASGRVTVRQPSPLLPRPEHVPRWTAAIANRGTPGFAVTTDAAMHVSLLRACTSWPSGVWIDPPRRSAPDGSAFQLQHWSHVFEHALFLEKGDWREAGCVEKALAWNRPLRAALRGPGSGLLPGSARLLGLEERPNGLAKGGYGGRVVLSALKPAGNPLASSDPPSPPDPPSDLGTAPAEGLSVEVEAQTGRAAPARPATEAGVTLRCYEAHGQPVTAEVVSAFPLAGSERANLLEEPVEVAPQPERAELGPSELATLRLRFRRPFGGAAVHEAGPPPAADDLEPALPVFSRYWLHNKGAAPMGNQGLAVHVVPTSVAARAGCRGRLAAHVASGAARTVQAGALELVGPEGWLVEPARRIFSLAPGAFLRVEVSFGVPEGCRPGRYFLAARATDLAGQAQEDVCTVDVLPALAGNSATHGQPGVPAAPFSHPGGQVHSELEATLETEEVSIEPGGSQVLGLRMANHTLGELHGELQLISPVETWPYMEPWAQGWELRPGEERVFGASVRAPSLGWLSTWALFKVTYFGRLWYSPSVALHLGSRWSPKRL